MEVLAFFTTAFVVGLSGALMPGPLTTVSFTESVRRGWQASPVVITGHSIAELAVVIALSVGLSQLLNQTLVNELIGLLGGGFLVWMGTDMVRAVLSGKMHLDLASAPSAGAVANAGGTVAVSRASGVLSIGLVATGILVSVSNPYWLMWWATVGSTFVATSLQLGIIGLAAFYFGHILSDYVWNGALGVIGHSGRRVLNDRIYGEVIAFCGVFVGLLGIIFICRSVALWLGIPFSLFGIF